ncbi:MAG: dihydrodipicolinate synthase family protein [Phycisphaerae bacterium]
MTWIDSLRRGTVIPAMPLALTASRKLDERRQRALCRYYAAAGAGGIAAAVHTTQFAIRDPHIGLFEPVLQIVAEEMKRADHPRETPLIRIGGICGETPQAVREATVLRDLHFHAGLLSLAALADADEDALIAHARAVADVIPVIGFYLQPAVGGRRLPYSFWRRFAEIENVVAIKIAPFNRYQTLDVVRAVAESGRDDGAAGGIALYTGNDDNIIADLITPFRFSVNARPVERHIVGGLLGHWSVWTKRAVEHLHACHAAHPPTHQVPPSDPALRTTHTGLSTLDSALRTPHSALSTQHFLRLNVQITDANAAFFDAGNNFAGCIAGLHEVLRRQGLLEGTWCLDEHETLSPGQSAEIDRVYAAYPHLNDDAFVRQHLHEWLA